MGKRFWFAFVILSILIIVVAYLRQSDSQPVKNLRQSLQSVVSTSQVAPTPMPFRELTIPLLRSQTYKSTLGGLQEVATNADYVEYLTSYLSDGLKINGLLTVPVGIPPTGGWPAIVFVHGYIPPKEYKTLEGYTQYIDDLARNGFVVFKIDLRGNGDSQGQPVGAYYSAGYVIDTLNAYAALQSMPIATTSASQSVVINPAKIGLFGHSMAGNIVMRAWAAKPTIPVVVIWAGAGYTYTDLEKYKIHDPSYQPTASDSANVQLRQQLQKLYGNPDLGNSFWHDLSPASYLTDLQGAVQLDQAVDDPVVNIGYNRDLNTLFDKTSVPHEFYAYPSGGHNIDGASFTKAMQHTVEFYKKYLE